MILCDEDHPHHQQDHMMNYHSTSRRGAGRIFALGRVPAAGTRPRAKILIGTGVDVPMLTHMRAVGNDVNAYASEPPRVE